MIFFTVQVYSGDYLDWYRWMFDGDYPCWAATLPGVDLGNVVVRL